MQSITRAYLGKHEQCNNHKNHKIETSKEAFSPIFNSTNKICWLEVQNFNISSISHREGDVMDCLHVLFEHNEQGKALAALHALERHVLPVLDPGVFAHG